MPPFLLRSRKEKKMSLISNINLCLNWTLTKILDLSTPRDSESLDRSVSFTDGTGAGQANCVFHDKRTLADAASETLDLSSQTDPLGVAITPAKLKSLFIYNKSAEAGLKIGAATTVPVTILNSTGILTLPPGGKLLFTAPLAAGVDISTNKNLKLEHDGTGTASLDYEIKMDAVD